MLLEWSDYFLSFYSLVVFSQVYSVKLHSDLNVFLKSGN